MAVTPWLPIPLVRRRYGSGRYGSGESSPDYHRVLSPLMGRELYLKAGDEPAGQGRNHNLSEGIF